MVVDIVTIFPQMIEPALAEGVVGRARAKGLVDVRARDLRDYTSDRHRVVDDVSFGGGPGMVMKPEPLFRAIEEIAIERGAPTAVILTTPQGRRFSHAEAVRFSRMERLIVICGRYEGVDERVAEALVTDEISIGDYVLTGGELPAMVVLDAVSRHVPGVVGKAESVVHESHSEPGYLEHPQYTRPEVFSPAKGVNWSVPEVLLSGDHKKVAEWREKHSKSRP